MRLETEDLGFRSRFFLEKIVLVVEWSGTPPTHPKKVVLFIDELVKDYLWVATTCFYIRPCLI